MENYNLLREANMTDSFILIVKKIENIRSFALSGPGLAAQDGGASKSSVSYNQRLRDCFSRGRSNYGKHKPTTR